LFNHEKLKIKKLKSSVKNRNTIIFKAALRYSILIDMS